MPKSALKTEGSSAVPCQNISQSTANSPVTLYHALQRHCRSATLRLTHFETAKQPLRTLLLISFPNCADAHICIGQRPPLPRARGVASGAMERGREEPRASPSPSSNAAAAVPVKVGSWIPPPISVNIDSPLKASKPAWNTHRMGARLGADLTAAACAGVLVAPVITIIDR